MSIPSVSEMLEAGVHFGHQCLRWNPKMRRYILTERNSVHIIDLAKTAQGLHRACQALQSTVASGEMVLFVGTKKSVRHCIVEEAERCGMFHATERWLGGMLTNFTTVKGSISMLENIEKMETDGLFKEMKKKEAGNLTKKRTKLESVLGGIRNMEQLPAMLIVVDTRHEHIAVKEARRLHIPIIAIVDTNSNPDEITYPIPGNDDAIKSVSLLMRVLGDAILEAKGAAPLTAAAEPRSEGALETVSKELGEKG